MKNWNILVVDDDAEIAANIQELISGNKVVARPDTITCKLITSFDEAIAQMDTSRFDLIVLDLKDDVIDDAIAQGEQLSGERVLVALRKTTFTPVIFHTGFAHKVEHLKSPFVRVVTKGRDTPLIREEIRSILDTQLPSLMRYIEEQQRSYLWDHIENHWNDNEKICEDGDLAHLVAKRLSSALGGDSIARFFNQNANGEVIRPVAMYIWPPVSPTIMFGDILKVIGSEDHFVVLTPSCDCAQGKAEMALLAACEPIHAQHEYVVLMEDKRNGIAVSKSKTSDLHALLRDRRKGTGVQPERYKFLPKTSFLPDLVIDLQKLSQVAFGNLSREGGYERVATLDNPFAEALQNRFTQYYGRVGTPDLDTELVFDRITT